MHLTDMTVEGVTFAIDISADGKFSTVLGGEAYEADSLSQLQSLAKKGIIATRYEIPFVSTSGRKGIIRGIHAGNKDALVTWSNGDKGRLDNYSTVYRADVPEEVIAEIQAAEREVAAAEEKLKAAKAKAGDHTVKVRHLVDQTAQQILLGHDSPWYRNEAGLPEETPAVA